MKGCLVVLAVLVCLWVVGVVLPARLIGSSLEDFKGRDRQMASQALFHTADFLASPEERWTLPASANGNESRISEKPPSTSLGDEREATLGGMNTPLGGRWMRRTPSSAHRSGMT